MKDEILSHLHDVIQAGRAIKGFVAGRTFAEYVSDELLRSAVERKFEVMGRPSTGFGGMSQASC